MPVFDLVVERRPSALSDARHAIARFLGSAVDPPALDALLVVVSELLSNGLRHGGDGSCRLRVDLTAQGVRVEVIDDSPERPPAVAVPAGPEAESGRGLLLVDALSQRWGSRPHRLGKCVWADLAVRGSEP